VFVVVKKKKKKKKKTTPTILSPHETDVSALSSDKNMINVEGIRLKPPPEA
jgi:hypothetical protein